MGSWRNRELAATGRTHRCERPSITIRGRSAPGLGTSAGRVGRPEGDGRCFGRWSRDAGPWCVVCRGMSTGTVALARLVAELDRPDQTRAQKERDGDGEYTRLC